jgi:hypothetical protein
MVIQNIKLEMPFVRKRLTEEYFVSIMELTLQKRRLALEASRLLEKLNSLPAGEEIKYLRACLQAL